MTKSLDQIQEENRKSIIMACNSEAKSYEEALRMELKDPLCILKIEGGVLHRIGFVNYQGYKCERDALICVGGIQGDMINTNPSISEILGKPLTLDRVLNSLRSRKEKSDDFMFRVDDDSFGVLYEVSPCFSTSENPCVESWQLYYKFDWDLTKQTLEEQPEETQKAINELLV